MPKAIEYVDTWVSYPGRYKCCDTFACMGPVAGYQRRNRESAQSGGVVQP